MTTTKFDGVGTVTGNCNFRLGIVIPLANEEATIANILTRIQRHLAPEDRVFCVVDRTCNDHTRDLIQRYHDEKDRRVGLVWAPENQCVVDAYFRGYREAYNSGCRWILEMDGGGTHLPEEIPQFIQGMEDGFSYVGGSRFMKGGEHKSPLSRRLISWGGTLLCRVLLKSPMSDMTSGFECFDRAAMKAVLDHGVVSRANFFQTEIRHLMNRRHWKEVPIVYATNNVTVGRRCLREACRVLFMLWRERRKTA